MRYWRIWAVIAVWVCGVATAESYSEKSTEKPSEKLFAYVSLEETVAHQLLAAFEKETGTHVEFVRLSTGEATARMQAEKNNPQASLWIGGGGLGHAEAKDKGLTEAYDAKGMAAVPAKYRDPQNYWGGIYLGVLAFAVNKNKIKELGLTPPQTWKDLLDPKWKGLIQLPNPATSGTSYNLITTLIGKDGEKGAFDYLKALHKNVSQYTRSGAAPTKNVAIGETVVAVGYAQDMIKLIHESNAPLEVIYPKDGTGYEIASVSLLKGAKQGELAKKLIDWLYTSKAAQVLADQYIVPIDRKGVSMKKDSLAPANLKLIDTNVDWAAKNKQRLIEEWNEKVNG